MKFFSKKTMSLFLIIVLAANIILFALGKNNVILFWFIIAICALFAYKVLPRM
jgi:hypothetical protein